MAGGTYLLYSAYQVCGEGLHFCVDQERTGETASDVCTLNIKVYLSFSELIL
jgi:hypothetical protein